MLKKGTIISFEQMNDFTGKMMKFQGEIVGHAKELKKKFPVELAEIINPAYLVLRIDPYGNKFHHCVFPEEIRTSKISKGVK